MRRVPTLSRAMEETLATSVDRIAALNRGSFGFVRQATGSPYLYSAGIRQPRGTFTPPGFEALDALGEAASARPDKDEAKLEYWEAAKRVPFPRGAVQFSNMPPDILAATDLLAELRHDAPRLRAEAIAVLSEISDNLEPLSAFMKQQQSGPTAACAADSHPALWAALIEGLGLPDVELPVEHCVFGAPVAGKAKDTGLFKLKTQETINADDAARTPMRDLMSSNIAHNKQLAAQMEASYAQALRKDPIRTLEKAQQLWQATLAEITNGTSSGPFKLFDGTKHIAPTPSVRAAKCFGVPQGDKVRLADDATANGVNGAASTPEKATMMPPDFAATVACRLYTLAARDGWLHELVVMISGDDEEHAYRNVPTSQPGLCIAYIIDPSTGKVVAVARRGHSFGHALAVPNYSRRPRCLVLFAQRLLLAPCDHYLDDITTVDLACAMGPPVVDPPEPGATHGRLHWPHSAQGSVRALAALLRIPLPIRKSTDPSQISDNCGVTTDVTGLATRGIVRLRVKASTATAITAAATEALQTRRLPPAVSGSLAGKFRWAFLLTAVGHAATQPLTKRQYETLELMTAEIEAALRFMIGALGTRLPDCVLRAYASPDSHALVASDASFEPPRPPLLHGSGVIAFMVFFPASEAGPEITVVASAPATQTLLASIYKLRKQATFIHGLEALGLAAPYCSPRLQSRFRGRRVLHCADSQAANGAMTRGYSAAPDLARIVAGAHIAMAHMGLNFWLHYTRSDANIADLPTRDGTSFVFDRVGAERIDFVMPAFEDWPQLPAPAPPL